MISPQTGELTFSDVTTASSGLYVCRVVIDIPEAQIFHHFDEAATTVNTDSEYDDLVY